MSYAPLDDGSELWYEDTGGNGPSVVFVHGMVGNSEGWLAQRPAFEAAGFRVISFDLRSHGRSRPGPGSEGAGSIARDIDALTAHLGLSSFFLVAQAYGAFGALEYAIDTPQKLKALVITCTMAGLAFATGRVSASLPPEERELGVSYRARDPEGVRRFLAIESHNDPPPSRQALREPMTLERMARIELPTLVISGDEDLYAPPELMRQMADRIHGSEFEVIKGAGHCAYWEQPEVWNGLVINFLLGLL